MGRGYRIGTVQWTAGRVPTPAVPRGTLRLRVLQTTIQTSIHMPFVYWSVRFLKPVFKYGKCLQHTFNLTLELVQLFISYAFA